MLRFAMHSPTTPGRSEMKLNPIIEQLGAYPIAMIQERARSLADAGVKVIDFSIGDPREPTPEFIADALKTAVPEVSQYPLTSGTAGLRTAIAAYLERRFSVTVDPDSQVMPTSGSKEAVFSSPLAFVDRDAKDAVAYGTPGYPIYERGALFSGASTIPIVLGGDFILRADDLTEEQWDRSRLVWTCTPHNPTGAVTSAAELDALVKRARESETLLMSDECYADVYEEDAHPGGPASVLQVAGPEAKGVLAFFSCSKRSGMTGYRSGAMVGDAEAIAALKKLRTATGTASPDFVQAAAAAAWGDDEHAAARRAIFAKKRAALRPSFEALGMEVVASTAGLYLWVKVGDDLAVTDRLLEHGIVVSPGRFFGPGGEGFLRLALVPTVSDCAEAAAAVEEALG